MAAVAAAVGPARLLVQAAPLQHQPTLMMPLFSGTGRGTPSNSAQVGLAVQQLLFPTGFGRLHLYDNLIDRDTSEQQLTQHCTDSAMHVVVNPVPCRVAPGSFRQGGSTGRRTRHTASPTGDGLLCRNDSLWADVTIFQSVRLIKKGSERCDACAVLCCVQGTSCPSSFCDLCAIPVLIGTPDCTLPPWQ